MLLVAPPTLYDPNFRRTVVLLCEHGPEGSFGLVLNRLLEARLDKALGEVLSGVTFDAPLAQGGPVQPRTLHYLHRLGEVPSAVHVTGDVYWGGTFDTIKEHIRKGNAQAGSLRFFLGYAGWSPGQLTGEMERSGWIPVRAEEALIFPDDPDGLWRSIMRQLGGEYALLSTFPDDPRMN